jgi:hypothetical protein
MKSFIFLLSLFVATTFGAFAQEPPPTGLDLKVLKVSSGTVTVELQNSSADSVRIFNESNSWGAAHWRILLLKNGRLETYFQNPNQLFTKNGPGYHELSKNGNEQKILDVNDGSWCGLDGQKVNIGTGDTVIVVYDVPPTKEGYKLKVWYGVSAAFLQVQ